jgi:hypothetical protein
MSNEQSADEPTTYCPTAIVDAELEARDRFGAQQRAQKGV